MDKLTKFLTQETQLLRSSGVYKAERIITSPQSNVIRVSGSSQPLLNFCANNYLGLASNSQVVERASEYITKYGSGLSSVRFICGTQDIHKELEAKIAKFHERQDSICYISCFDANAGFFESLFGPNDAIFSDELNHASIIDGIRLCKATKFRYKHRDMDDLKKLLDQNRDFRFKIIVSDGVFSMDGTIAPLKEICDLADQFECLTFIDECHATGFFGPTGRGTEEHLGLQNRVSFINSTLGKALGGAAGGYTTGPKVVIDWLRQKSRPYLFSNSIPPAIVGSAMAALDIVMSSSDKISTLKRNTDTFRSKMKSAGFTVIGDDHPICPVMMADEKTAVNFADKLLEKGIYVIGFTFPVVPRGKARIRVQINADHSLEEVQSCVDAFIQVRDSLN